MTESDTTTTQPSEAPVKRGRKPKAAVPATEQTQAPMQDSRPQDALPTKEEIAEHLKAFAACAEFEKNALPLNAQNSFTSEHQYRFSRLMLLVK